MKIMLAILLLCLSAYQSYAATECEQAKQYGSSTKQLVDLAAANGIAISKKDQAKIARCFKKSRKKHRL